MLHENRMTVKVGGFDFYINRQQYSGGKLPAHALSISRPGEFESNLIMIRVIQVDRRQQTGSGREIRVHDEPVSVPLRTQHVSSREAVNNSFFLI